MYYSPAYFFSRLLIGTFNHRRSLSRLVPLSTINLSLNAERFFTTSHQNVWTNRAQFYAGSAGTENKQLCWNCSCTLERVQMALCSECKHIQPLPDNIDFFAYIGVKPQFGIDDAELRQRFRRMQSLVHPDRFSQSSEQEHHFSEQHSAFLNNAYRILRDPYERAQYLLSLLDKLEDALGESELESADPNLAIEMMELNENIEQIDSKPELEKKKRALDRELGQLFRVAGEQLAQSRRLEAKYTMQRISFLRSSHKLVEKILAMQN